MATTLLRRAWLAYGAAGLVLLAVGLPQPALAHAMFYNLTGLSAVAAILLGVRLHRPPRRGM